MPSFFKCRTALTCGLSTELCQLVSFYCHVLSRVIRLCLQMFVHFTFSADLLFPPCARAFCLLRQVRADAARAEAERLAAERLAQGAEEAFSICIYIYIYIYIYYVYMYVCMYVCIYIYIYECTS